MAESETETPEVHQQSASGQVAHRQSLERRLSDGYARIDEALLAGTDVAQWEAFWIKLLREYEDVCRELDIAA